MKKMRYFAFMVVSWFCAAMPLWSAPQITNITPNAGPIAGGTTVSIQGTGLLGATAVSFGDLPATPIISNSDTEIQVQAPQSSLGSADITVTTSAGTSSIVPEDQYTYQANWNVYVANATDPLITVIDSVTKGLSTIPTAGPPPFGHAGIAITPNGKSLYACAAGIDKLNLNSNTLSGSFSSGLGFFACVVSPDGQFTYASSRTSPQIHVLNNITLNETDIVTPYLNFNLCISPDGKFLYATNQANSRFTVIDIANASASSFKVSPFPNTIPFDCALSPDGKFLYITDAQNLLLHVIDTSNNTEVLAIPADVSYGIALTPDGKFAVTANPTSNSVSKIDLTTKNVVTTPAIPLTGTLYDVVITPDGKTGFVVDQSTGKVFSFDIATLTIDSPVLIFPGVFFHEAITPDQAPAAQFSITSGPTTTFDASRSQTATGTIVKYVWDFGDGTPLVTETQPKTSHTYTTGGTFNATLTVTNSAGTSTKQVFTGKTMMLNGSKRAQCIKTLVIADNKVLPPKHFRGKIVEGHHAKIALKTKWQKSTSKNVVTYEIFRGGKRIAKISASKDLSFKIQTDDVYSIKRAASNSYLTFPATTKKHDRKQLDRYEDKVESRYKIRAGSSNGAVSDFVFLKID